MSWINDLASGLGIPAGAAMLAVAMYRMSNAAEKTARPGALRDIAGILKDPSWSSKMRPSILIERIFLWTFGTRQSSWKCWERSMAATLIFAIIFGTVNYPIFSVAGQYLTGRSPGSALLGLGLNFAFSGILADYIALGKTRVLLRLVASTRHGFFAIPPLDAVGSLLISVLMSLVGFEVIAAILATSGFHWARGDLARMINDPEMSFLNSWIISSSNLWSVSAIEFRAVFSLALGHVVSMRSILFFSTLLTSVWTLLIVLSTVVLKLLPPLQRFTTWYFDVDKHPVQAIGIVSGSLVMAGSLMWFVVRVLI